MIVRTLRDAMSSDRKVASEGWESVRLLLEADNMGFSFHITTIFEGAKLDLHYQNHLESVFCLSGDGEVVETETGKVHPVEPGTIYILDRHDKHQLRAHTEMIMACVFNPALRGREVHNADGSYELDGPAIT